MSGRRPVGRLHVLTDESLQDRFSHTELARMAFEGGADVVQLREKRERTTAELVRLAREIHDQAVRRGAMLVVNDRVDVALASGARAVHLGRDDLDPALAREWLGRDAIIGATANSLDEALRVAALPVDYVGVGPVFGTSSKRDPAPALGLDGLRAIVEAVARPVVAIGNITAERAGDVMRAGAWGVAVLSAVVCRPDPLRETRRLRDAIETALEGIEPVPGTETEAAGGIGTLPRLMLVTDRGRTRRRDLARLVEQAVAGGVGIVQLREKDLADDELRGLLDRIRKRLPTDFPLVVNGSTRVARTMKTGLHLGAGVPFPTGPADGCRSDYALFGRSAHDLDEAERALRDDPSYLILGTIYPTRSKPGHPGAGPSLVESVARRVRPLPVYAIGGIGVSKVPELIRAGAHGVAVCGAILSANDPGRVAEALALALEVSSRAASNR